MSVKDLHNLLPSNNWFNYFSKIGFQSIDSVVVSQPKYLSELEQLFKTHAIQDLKNYMKWTVLRKNPYGSYKTKTY